MISIRDFEILIEDHMKQQPYKCTCNECGSDLEFDIELDNDLDLTIRVGKCSCT